MEASKVFCSSYSFDSSLLFILFRCLYTKKLRGPVICLAYFDVLVLDIDPNTLPQSLCFGLSTSLKLSLIEDSIFRYIAVYSATSQYSSAMLSSRLMFFWLFAAFHVANALNAAAPYEAIYFYNAYKMEFATTLGNPTLRTIAPGCVHRPTPAPPATPAGIVEANFIQSTIDAGLPGICSFEDFLRGPNGIQNADWRAYRPINPAFPNPTSLTVTLDPNADAFAARALNPATLGRNRLGFLTDNLLSAAVRATYVTHTPAGLPAYAYGRTITKISDAVQTARLAVASGAVVPDAFHDVCLAHLLDNSTMFIGSTRVENLRNVSESATTNSILYLAASAPRQFSNLELLATDSSLSLFISFYLLSKLIPYSGSATQYSVWTE